MIRWRHYTVGVYGTEGIRRTQHVLAFKLFGRYLITTWVWD